MFGALADAVDLVDEDDARCLLARGAEQRLDLLDADAEVHRREVAACHLDEAGIRFPGQRLGQLGLAGAGFAGQQHALGWARAKPRIGLRVAQVGGDVAQRLLGLAGADHVIEADLAALALDLETAAAHRQVDQRQNQHQGER